MQGKIIGVVGLGTMGLGIAQVFAVAGAQVLATDSFAPARGNAPDRMAEALSLRVSAGKLTPEAREATLSRFHAVEGPQDMGAADLVIEAILEDLAAKHVLFGALEAVLRPTAVLATNTSSLSVAAVARGLRHPERVLGLHFFNPAPAMKLVELVAHPGTDTAALTTARQLAEAAGKTVIGCPDRPGFVVNRCARPFYGEALAMLEEGRTASDIDAAMVGAGYRLGPFALIDLIGADINLAATMGLWAAMGRHPRYHPFEALKAQVARGDLGRKTGRGFLFPSAVGPTPQDADAIVLRIEAALVNEACWLAAEGVAIEGIDAAMKLGLNFPRGPFECLQAQGKARILSELARLAAAASPALKPRYTPAPLLEAL